MRRIAGEQPPLEPIRLREWLTRLVTNINSSIEQNSILEVVPVGDGDIVALPNQVLICKNTVPITVTLPVAPPIGTVVHVKRRNDVVTVIGTIDGLTDIIINVVNYSVHLYYDGIDWSII